MKSSILVVFIFFIVIASAFHLNTEGPYRLIGKKHQRNVAELKAYQQKRRVKAEAEGKNFIPTYPEEVIHTEISVGDSAEKFLVALETGSHELWLLGSDYPQVGPNEKTFNPNDPKSTAKKGGNFSAISEDYQVFGTAYTDKITFFNVQVTQTFGSINHINGFISDPPIDGVISGALGLAWDPTLAKNKPTPDSNPILNLFAAQPSLPRIISQVTKHDETTGQFVSSITILGQNLLKYCNPTPVAVADLVLDDAKNPLSFAVDSVSFGKQKTINWEYAKVDTGLSVMFVPNEPFMWLYLAMHPTFDYNVGVYTTSCSNRGAVDDFVITINGADLRVPSTSYIVDLGFGNDTCVLTVYTTVNSFATAYSFGTNFLYNYGVEWSIDKSTITFKTYL